MMAVAALLALAITPALATRSGTAGHGAATRPAAGGGTAAPAARPGNPLLPAQIATDGLYPELTLNPKLPGIAPTGFAPLYTAEDWAAYRAKFGKDADDLARRRASQHLEFANALIAAAEAEQGNTGLKRLLLVRAAAVAYRNHDGYAVASRAMGEYKETIDLNVPSQVAVLWTLEDAMARYSATPRGERPACGAIAAKANIQLAMLLADAGQLDGAQRVIGMLGRHEGAVRADATLRGQAATARANVGQTIVMMEYLAGQVTAINGGDANAALPLYVYAKFVKPWPALVQEIVRRPGVGGGGVVGQIEAALAAAEKDPVALYTAGELLKNVSANLPEGILRSRTLYASLLAYRGFMTNPKTEGERVKRTLARMAMQSVLADGARGQPHVRPFDPPATQPAASQPATRPGTRRPAGPTPTPVPVPAPTPAAPPAPGPTDLTNDPGARAVG